VYQFFDKQDKIIYIGKAKNLKKRVTSYFLKQESASGKLRVLVKKITDIRFVVVDTEADALLLENNLIKKYKPRYNVLLKDDKTFPWICIKNERFPRVFQTRNVIKDGSAYYGPYTSVKLLHTLLDLIRSLYPLRTCKLNLSKENIQRGKYKVCLEYHIGKCKGPCEGMMEEKEYMLAIEQIRGILKGNITQVLNHLKELMAGYAAEMAFEKAQMVKEKIDIIETFQAKSTIVNPTIHDVEVYSIVSDEESAFVNYLKVINGAIIQAHTIELKKKLDESDVDLLAYAITDMRQRFASRTRNLLLPFALDMPGTKVQVPQVGDKKKLLELSERNARYFKFENKKAKIEYAEKRNNTSMRLMKQMKSDLRMSVFPEHIECFDNSNIQGTHPVAAMVVFKKGKPAKSEYRHYKIKTVEGPDDYASMQEVVYRRYKRLLDENAYLPQLIVIDGGKGQLNAALNSLNQLGLRGKITIIGIAKRLEEIYFPGDTYPLYLDKTSPTLRVIQHIRDEAHRFGITHHRHIRTKGQTQSELDQIKGIGPKTKELLFKEFKSISAMRKASLIQLSDIIGESKARLLLDYFASAK